VAAARYTSAFNGVLEKIALIRVRAAELSLTRQQLADSAIIAPFTGYIQERHVGQGSFVQIGDPIVTLVRTSVLRFRGTLPERHAVRLAVGQQVRLHIESVPEPLVVQISRLSPVVNAQNRSLMFEAEVPNHDGRLQTGLFAEAQVIVDPDARAIILPPSAISEFAGAEKVWKVVDGMAQEQTVMTGRRREEGIEIISGIAAGDAILHDASQGKIARIDPVHVTSVARPVALSDPPDETADDSAGEFGETGSAPAIASPGNGAAE
jgi:membrane fusion protein (multidrug efflux system)